MKERIGAWMQQRWVAPVALLVVLAGFYWKLTLTSQFEWIWGADLAEQVLPWFEVQAHAWHAGEFPMWDTTLWAGQPLLGQAQPGAAYPLNWLLALAPLKNGHIQSWVLAWYYVLIHWMAAVFCFAFCRELGVRRLAAMAGGLIYALAGYLGTDMWPQMANGAVWIPLVFLFQLRALRGASVRLNGILAGTFLGVSYLSGHHQVPMLATVTMCLAWLWYRKWAAGGLSLVAMLAAGAFQILPALEYGHLAMRWTGEGGLLTWNQMVPYLVHADYGLQARSLFGLLVPGLKVNFDPFIGTVAFALAALAVAQLWGQRETRWLFSMGLGALVYALGHQCVFQGVAYAVVPQLNKARSPSAAVVLMQFAAAALAARGLDLLLKKVDTTPWLRRIELVAAGFGALVGAVCLILILTHEGHFPGDDRVVATALVALLLGLALHAYRRGLMKPALLTVLLVFELGLGSQYLLVNRRDTERMMWLNRVKANAGIASWLRAQPGFARATVPGKAFAENWGSYHGVDMFRGELASVTANVLESGIFDDAGPMLYGVRYTLTPQPQEREALPRAWSSHEIVRAPSRKAGFEMLRSRLPGHDFAYMTGPPPAVERCTGEDRVELLAHRGNSARISARMACTGMVVLSDTYYPGWQATVDGAPAPIYEVDGALRGVVVAAGAHTVEMRYRPRSVFLGAAFTLLSLCLACGVGWAARQRASKA